jgi:hypothetical protein
MERSLKCEPRTRINVGEKGESQDLNERMNRSDLRVCAWQGVSTKIRLGLRSLPFKSVFHGYKSLFFLVVSESLQAGKTTPEL